MAFVVACLATLIAPIFFPSLRLFFFAPYIASMIQKKELPYCLWVAFSCGLFLDVISSESRFGLVALDFTLATLLSYQLKGFIFRDHFSTFPLLTFGFASASACLQAFIEALFDHVNIFSWPWFLSDILIMPFLDALFALLFVISLQAAQTFFNTLGKKREF